MSNKGMKIGSTIAIAILVVIIIGCAVWFGVMLGRGMENGSFERAAQVSSSVKADQKEATFDGSGFTDTGAGTMFISSAGGTSENGNIPKIAYKKGTGGTGIVVNYDDGDGSICDIYIDGVKYETINASRVQQSITFEGSALDDGVHTVEVVKLVDGVPEIYKKAQYEIVSH